MLTLTSNCYCRIKNSKCLHVTCSSCKKSWTRKEGYNNHFDNEEITSGASRSQKLVPNPCYKARVRSLCYPGSGKQPAITSLLGKRKLSDITVPDELSILTTIKKSITFKTFSIHSL